MRRYCVITTVSKYCDRLFNLNLSIISPFYLTVISKDDGLPEQMCSSCVYKLGVAYHFKQTCESADIRLRQYLGLRIPSKTNDAMVMTDPIAPTYSTIIKKCKCKLSDQKRTSSNYKKKSESEKQKRGPKPKPKQIHSCYQCNKQFRCQAQLEMHVRTHTGVKPFVCMYCPRRFTQKHNLTIHLRVHTGEKPFQCEVCSKRFSAQGNLQAHLKIHTGQKDHECTLCNKSFITSSELTRHLSKHRGIKNFKCDLCGAAYIHSRDLKLHKLKKHQIDSKASKMQTETFNNGSNIDIIGIDVGKESTIPMKDVNHLLPHLIEKQQNIPPITDHSQPILSYEQKKEIYMHYPKVHENHSCAICGEGFLCVNALAQHYLHRHKGYDILQKNYTLTQ
ncbi:zinc finger protein Xfin isoform X2 [Manduca sexta]|uniref:zinc finger protein Xfin isoform X2 n=1 Tax=Manduca sexta TaxID=7130 RepID=UPI0018902771|nr:zinc finger protein Xfin isoform X2 [Manduca sexta]